MSGTEEYITVFSGNVDISAGEDTFSLSEGDSLRFKADTPHSYKNTGDTTVYMSMLIYYSER